MSLKIYQNNIDCYSEAIHNPLVLPKKEKKRFMHYRFQKFSTNGASLHINDHSMGHKRDPSVSLFFLISDSSFFKISSG